MTLHVKLISIIAALALTAALAYSSGDRFFLEGVLPDPSTEESAHSSAKQAAKKSGNVKQTGKDPEYSFFETLQDSRLEKQVGLQGKVEVFSARPPGQAKSIKPVSEPPVVGSLAGDIQDSVITQSQLEKTVKESGKSAEDVLADSFLVQAASFKNADHAQKLANKLKSKGYGSFMKKAEPQGGDPWYRVYLGRFRNKEKALEVVRRARLEERLNPIVVLQRNQG